MPHLTVTLPLDDLRVPAVLAALNIKLPAVAAGARGNYVDSRGIAVLDDIGVAIVAEPRNASDEYLAGLRLIASRNDVTEADLLAAVGAASLAGHKMATTKRTQRALGGKDGVLFKIINNVVVMADETRDALVRHFAATP